jgi:hypothetical protein
MADEYGLELVIPDGFIEKLQKADEELEYTAMQAEETKESVIKAFREMGDQGVDYFLKKLNEMQNKLGQISSKNISLKSLETSAKGAAKVADDVVKVADAFGQISEESPRADEGLKNIDEVMVRMMNDIKAAREELSLYDDFLKKNVISIDEYNKGVADTSDRLESMMRQYEALDKARISLSGEDGADLAVERKNQELAKLNEAYRTGTSELQKQAKAEDEQAKEIQKQQKEQAKLAKQQAKEDERHQKALEKQQKEQERINKAKEEEQRKTYQGALSYSSNAKNMLEDANAIKYLEAARAKLDRTDSDYTYKLKTLNNAILQHKKNIAQAKGETITFERQQRSLINTADQLKRKLALVFSVSALTGYFKKMVEVRGEFELQKVALSAILQNKEKADELWAKTQELALQSPFKLQQLVTFTKQLAAYQVEADKLYETNKRLADVSAGLGVEMNRLILAFGQVKAANYLRSAEIRQFTEAGINMLGELSKLYTEIEGKIVSVGEVQARVQKRLVSFADVEEVFKRMTDAGGMFYNMQEKQAETLKGMVAKLQDALDIMFNQIGEANQGVLKGMVNMLLKILQSWETIGQVAVPIITVLVSRMLLLKSITSFGGNSKIFKGLIDSLKLVAAQVHLTTYSFQGMKAMVSTTASAFAGWTAILSAVVIAIWELTAATRAHNKEQKQLNQVAIDSTYNAHKLAVKYETLAKTIQDQTASFQDQKDAIDELKRTYGDILPVELLEIDNIRAMGDEYDKARQAIYSYIETKAKQKQIEIIDANEGQVLNKRKNSLVKNLYTILSDIVGETNVQRYEVANIVDRILKAQEDGMIETLQDARTMLEDLIEETFELSKAQQDVNKIFYQSRTIEPFDVKNMLRRMLDANTDYINAINTEVNSTVGLLDASQRKLEEARKKFEQEYAYIPEAFQSTQYWDKMTEAQKDRTLYILRNFYQEMGEEMPDWSTLFNDPLRFDEETRRFNQMWLDAQVLDVARHYDAVEEITNSTTQVLQATWDKFTQDVQQKIDTQNLEDWQKLIVSGIHKFAEANDIALTGMNSIVPKAGQTMKDYFEGIDGDIENLKQDIGQANLDRKMFPNAVQPTSDESLKNMEQQLALFEYILSLYYNAKQADKESDKADREALNLLKERVRLIQEANKEYEKNLQYFSEEEAVAKTLNSYKNAFKQAGISNLLDKQFLTDEGVLKALAQLPINVGGKLRDEALQYIADSTAKVSVELDIDTSQRTLKDLKTQVEELFDGIDIFQDLVKIGFTEEEVRRIFGIEITNTEQLRRRLEEMKDEFIGTKGIDEYNTFMRKINDMEDKQNVERLKRYEKYLKTMMSETAEIRIQALQDIQDVMKMSGRSSEEKQGIIEGINKEAQKKLQEQQWKQFQESDDYQLLFSDIEHLSVSTATRLKDVLDNLRTSLNELTPHQLRQIQSQYEKLDEQIIKRNPFDAVRESMEAIKGLVSESDLNNYMAQLTEQRFDTQENIDALDILINAKQKGLDIDQLDERTKARINGLEYETLDALMQIRKEQEGYMDDILKEQGWTEEQINKYKRLRKAMDAANDTWKGVMSNTKQTLSDIKGAYEAMNDGAQSITLEMVDAGITLADASYQMVELLRNFKTFKKEAPGLGAALNTSLGIIGLIATAVQTIINVINMIASAHDESLEEDIKRYENQVNRLADAYDRLAEKIQKAYSFAMLATSTNQGLTNLQEQVVAYERMIDAERDKKDSDGERIEEWTDKIEELRAKMEETKKSAVQEAGGLGGEYKDAAQGFVDAWMQAFRETGNGLDALNEHFEDFLWDIASKQVLLRAADKFYEPLFEDLDRRMMADTSEYDKMEKDLKSKIEANKHALESATLMPYEMAKELRDSNERTFGDFGKYFDDIENDERRLKDIQAQRQNAIQNALMLDDEDFEALKKQYEVSGKNFDEFAKNFLTSLGFKGGEGGDTLSGLQKGIQGITESTAEIIEAYLNSVRFFVSDSNQKLTELLERFVTNDETRSPILAELRLQTDYLIRICQRVESAINMAGYRVDGTGYIKAQM